MDWADLFYYEPTSPSALRWKVARLGGSKGNVTLANAGDVAGSKDKRGRWSVSFDNKNYLVHRIVFAMFNGPLGEIQVDHEDGDTGNNLIGNLRKATSTINNRNRAKSSRNTTGHTGVAETCGAFKVTWTGSNGRSSRSFSIAKYGRDEALKLAVALRNNEILRLNSEGAGYTERHGK